MSLDVDLPDPPELDTVDPSTYDDTEVGGDDYRRDELEEFLRDGAWADAFDQWSAHSDLSDEEWEIVTDLDLLSRFDFFWNYSGTLR